ncbi:hypothetical protein FUAX_34180 [Fulvitalea axinellae]|uniref:Ead/Ea22-like family protein n=1 Tax=Fulvitalea axinellae TaxID=1182444 RepID=A0AAU9CFN0_9BACT|nr:hypothetical protein FUAX_34180 [Fulvitalea axinellae]
MKKIEITSSELINYARYARIASNIAECQAYLKGEEAFLSNLEWERLKIVRKELRLAAQSESWIERGQSLNDEVTKLTVAVARETDPKRKDYLEASLKTAEGELEMYNLEAQDREKTPESILIRETSRRKFIEAQQELHREAVLDYIRDFVVPGNVGEGTVIFEGQEYATETVGA